MFVHYRKYRLVSTLMVLILLTNILLQVNSSDQYSVDPIPFEKLLNDALAHIIDGNYINAVRLIDLALNIKISDPAILNQHIKLYNTLRDINSLLNQTTFIERDIFNKSINEAKIIVRNTYNKLYTRKEELENTIKLYISSLNRYARDKPSFLLYKLKIDEKLKLLKTKLDNTLNELREIYTSLDKNMSRGKIKILLDIPPNIYAGKKVKVKLKLIPMIKDEGFENKTCNATMLFMMYIGDHAEIINKSHVVIPSEIEYTVSMPSTPDILKKNIEIKRGEGATYSIGRIILKIQTSRKQFILRGFKITDFKIYMLKPKVFFNVPSYAYIDSNLTIKVRSYADTALNVSIYIDRITSKTNLLNTTISPGNSSIIMKLSNITPGYHTIIFVTLPKGKYLSEKWSSALAITYKSMKVILNVPRITIGSSFSMNIKGCIKGNNNYTLIVKIDGKKVYEKTFFNKEFDIVVNAPFTLPSLFIWSKRLEIEIIPQNPNIMPVKYSFNVLTINTVFISLLVILTSIICMHPSVISSLSSFFYRVYKILIEEKVQSINESLLVLRPEKIKNINIRFRPFRLKKYYILFIRLLSIKIKPPHESETLREYLNRIKNEFPETIYVHASKLIRFFELDLYSRIRVDIKEVKESIKRIEKLIRHEA